MILDMGKGVEGVLATTEQSPLEHYRIGQNVKAYVLEVRRTPRGPALFVSRTHKGFLQAPVRARGPRDPQRHGRDPGDRPRGRQPLARSPSRRRQEGLDPVGATVGQRGARVQAVVAELGGEKIDVIPWNDDPAAFVANALSPAQVLSVDIDQEHRIANVTVPERMLSLAIGREGQNARLAARLTGWRIDIRSDVSVAEAKAAASKRGGGSRARPRAPEAGGGRADRRRSPRRRADAAKAARARRGRTRPSRRGRRRRREPPRPPARARPTRRSSRRRLRRRSPTATQEPSPRRRRKRADGTAKPRARRPRPPSARCRRRRARGRARATSGPDPVLRRLPTSREKRDLLRDRPHARRDRRLSTRPAG